MKKCNIKVKEVRVLSAQDLRSLCIENNYYTRGDNEEYSNLFEWVGKQHNMTTTKIMQVAQDIFEHSSAKVQSEQDIESIAFNVARVCTTYFIGF